MEAIDFKFLFIQGGFAVLAAVVMILYHRAFLAERKDDKGEKERLEKREERILVAFETNATINTRLSDSLSGLAVAIKSGEAQRIESLTQMIRELRDKK